MLYTALITHVLAESEVVQIFI